MKLIICLGPCCSGKTTWCKKYLENNPTAVRFSIDDFKLMLTGNLGPEIMTDEFRAIIDGLIMNLLLQYKHLIVDGYFLDLKKLWILSNTVKDHEIILFDISLGESAVRNQLRKKKTGIIIPPQELQRFHQMYEKFVSSPGFKNFAKSAKIKMNENVFNEY